ncbi:hypothetical protein [Streptomyces pseudovenezuelae]|uniref:Tox-REase-5 domain-containing protein n=1 Tax=Streptomyces pseudovenezuelae TaxID=67350 RepID=A0ABT6LZF2_9ACTN|nr:hypothetical protein [Streptomyces pseudovenezuelae]MDH6221682.1 hypothetical protein [Streptomyces pseudovenezuelae]
MPIQDSLTYGGVPYANVDDIFDETKLVRAFAWALGGILNQLTKEPDTYTLCRPDGSHCEEKAPLTGTFAGGGGLLGGSPKAGSGESAGRAAERYGRGYEVYLEEKLGGGGVFSEKGRQFDGAYIDPVTGKGTWHEAKSGEFFENTLKNPTRLSKFYSTEGQKFGIANERGIDYRVISENPIPEKISNWLDKKGIPWEVMSR